MRSTPNLPGYPPKENMIAVAKTSRAHTYKRHEHTGYTLKRCRDGAWSCRNGVVYTYLACKHSQGLPEEQQVPTDTTAESSWLYTSPVHRVHTRKVGGALKPNISSSLWRNKKPPWPEFSSRFNAILSTQCVNLTLRFIRKEKIAFYVNSN